VLYYATLDPAAKYDVEMEYIGAEGAGVGVDSIVFASTLRQVSFKTSLRSCLDELKW